jgi:hypothetical protein
VKRAGPQELLQGNSGDLQADAYGGDDGIHLDSGGMNNEVAWLAHAPRAPLEHRRMSTT